MRSPFKYHCYWINSLHTGNNSFAPLNPSTNQVRRSPLLYLGAEIKAVLHLEGAVEAALAGAGRRQVVPHLGHAAQLDATRTR